MFELRRLKSWPLAQSATLVFLLLLLVLFDRGEHLVFGGLSFLLLAGYHLLSDHRFSPEQIRASGLIWPHIGVYLLLCTLVIWATSGKEDESPYWIVYVMPILVAATQLEVLATLATCGLSFALFGSVTYYYLPATEVAEESPELLVFGLMLLMVGVLVQTFSAQNRHQLARQKDLNDELVRQQEALRESLARLEAAEETLRRRDRLAALGEMSAGIAHEIRNPLGIITSSAQLLARRLTDRDPGNSRLLAIVQEETNRLNRLITDFLTFGRPAPPHLRNADLREVLQQALENVQALAEEKGVALTAELPGGAVPARIDQEMLRQAFLNLLLNALDASAGGGRVTVLLDGEGKTARLEVRDTGCGIPEENLSRIFNPFFTTKAKGTGLGLANAHKMIEAHHGEITVRSIPGEGAVFTVRLPLGGN